MNLLQFFSLLTLIKLILADPWCKTEEYYDNKRIVTTIGESYQYKLDGFFKGYNLTYTFPDLQPSGHKLLQGANEMDHKIQTFDTLEASYVYEFDDQSLAVGVLAKNPEYDYQELYFAYTEKDKIPDFNYKAQLTDPGYEEYCYDLVQLNQWIMAISCISRIQAPTFQQWKINITLIHMQTSEEAYYAFDAFTELYSLPENVLLRRYIHGRQTYLLHSIMFEQLEGEQREHTYVDVFRYVDPDDGHPFGTLTQVEPIDEVSLNTKKLQITYIEEMYERMFILDNTKGVFSLNYTQDSALDVVHFNPFIPKYWAMQVNHAGSQFLLTIVSSSTISEYLMPTVRSTPQLNYHYQTTYIVENQVKLQCTARYIALGIGSMLFVYDRYSPKDNMLHFSAYNIYDYYLLFSNQFYLFHPEYVTLFALEESALEVSPVLTMPDHIEFIITATSTEFGDTKQCNSTVTSVINKETEVKSIFDLYRYYIPDNGVIAGDWPSKIYLDTDFAGPNITYGWEYSEPNFNNTFNKFNNRMLRKNDGVYFQPMIQAQKSENTDYVKIMLDVPREAELISPILVPIEEIGFMHIERISEFSFYLLYQHRSKFTVYIEECEIDNSQFENPVIFCSEEAPIHQLDDEIYVWATGHYNYSGDSPC